MDMTLSSGLFPYPKVKQGYIKWDSLPLDVWVMVRKLLLYNKTSWNVLSTALGIKSQERGSTPAAEFRVPLHHHGFVMDWGLDMFVGVVYYFILA